ncbi:MAG TPA: hypothetical protein ENI27_00215 [bacterium]|nr:hypothetical protein [bacterium]
MMTNCEEFTKDIIEAIFGLQRIREIVKGPARRLRKMEADENITQINIVRQQHSSVFSEKGQEILRINVPGLNNQLSDNHFDTADILARETLQLLYREAIPEIIKCNCTKEGQ